MDLRQTIHNDISRGRYECVVCYERIGSKTPIWSCKNCYRAVDLKCIRKWAERTADTKAGFKCPHCLLPQKKGHLAYRCWCRKEVIDARHRSNSSRVALSSDDSIPPHSCGQTCGAKRKCPHPCPLTCHAGPHLDSRECTYMGPRIKCYCGKQVEQVVCNQSRYGGFSCAAPCMRRNRICGHECPKNCHEPSTSSKEEQCGRCERMVSVSCFCKRSHLTGVPCYTLSKENRLRLRRNNSASQSLTISCGRTCDKLMNCGNHRCERKCHGNSRKWHTCSLTPYEGETCFCGKELANRNSCTDPRVSCGNLCGRKLTCDHECQETCHDGPCPPCHEIINSMPCRCKRTVMDAVCCELEAGQHVCGKKCGASLSCGRHHCDELCCQFSTRAIQQLTTRRNALENMLLFGTTNMPKSKGKSRQRHHHQEHTSEEPPVLATEGEQRRIIERERDDILSTIEAAKFSHICNRICGRLLSCQSHTCPQPCHTGPCPPCLSTFFEEWECPCGRTKVLPPIRCGTVMPSCDKGCHRPQHCGHRATHVCHPDDIACAPCTEVVPKLCECGKNYVKARCSETYVKCKSPCGRELKCGHICRKLCCPGGEFCLPCTSACNAEREECEHVHETLCHFPEPCPSDCSKKLVAKCPCGALSLVYTCGEDLEISCNDTCEKESYAPALLNAYDSERQWITRIESKIVQFVQSDQKSLWFQPMSTHHRRLVYLLLEHYDITGEGVDGGKLRSVRASRTDNTRMSKFTLRNAPRTRPQLDTPETEEDSTNILSDAEINDNEEISDINDESIVPSPRYIEVELEDGFKTKIRLSEENTCAETSENTEAEKLRADISKTKNLFSLLE